MYKLVDFVPGHAAALQSRPAARKYSEIGAMKEEMVKQMAVAGHAFSLLTNGHLIASGGIYPIWPGFGEAWFLSSDMVVKHKRPVIVQLKKHIDALSKEHEYHRIQATAREDFTVGQRFLEFLGFEREGLLRNYGPDKSDHYMYARIIDG